MKNGSMRKVKDLSIPLHGPLMRSNLYDAESRISFGFDFRVLAGYVAKLTAQSRHGDLMLRGLYRATSYDAEIVEAVRADMSAIATIETWPAPNLIVWS